MNKTMVPEGAPEDWQHVRITNVFDQAQLKKIINDGMKKSYLAGSVILPQDKAREVAVQVLWKGTAKVFFF
jgi:hypothetical protein